MAKINRQGHSINSWYNQQLQCNELNQQLADQLEDLLNRGQNSSQTELQNPTGPETQNISYSNATQNAELAVYCTTGKHWIHYRCQNLK